MLNAPDILTGYVLAKLVDEPVAERARLYRALADLAAPADRERFLKLAADCDAIEASHAQLVFDFQRRNGSKA